MNFEKEIFLSIAELKRKKIEEKKNENFKFNEEKSQTFSFVVSTLW